ncbi:hypothetical protein A1Q2_01954 [Trichosporon asahii var. asahii CBS 8904]|uniref:Uncharacterized protein n=1 Tax=Trichosporon asahii var. asahii (strain CBS 8904) TaxID=1220162 RepID=K1W4E4_TRIAC|nr:hypothetical protein A1Q2_01954 [Trichosporon asahii var. asahii CBS 8904]
MSSFSSNFPSNSTRTPASRRRPLSMYGSDMSSGNVMTTSAYDSLDDWGGASVLQRGLSSQNLEIIRLNSEVALLKEQLAGRPTQDDLDELKNEWQTTEQLFAESQKPQLEGESDPPLAKLTSGMLRPAIPQPTAIPGIDEHAPARHAKLGAMKASTSMSSSTSVTPLSRSRIDSRPSHSVRDYDTSTSSNDRLDVDVLLGSQLQPANRAPPRQASPKSPTPASRDRVLEQVETLTGMIKSMPSNLVETVLEQLELNEAMRKQSESRKEAATKKEKEEDLKLAESKLERRNQILLEMLDAAERRAEARELRLQTMLAEPVGRWTGEHTLDAASSPRHTFDHSV